MAFIDMTGWIMKEHGVADSRLTVIQRVQNSSSGYVKWLCQCECGRYIEAYGTNIRRGRSKSCGCYHIEVTKEKRKAESIQKDRHAIDNDNIMRYVDINSEYNNAVNFEQIAEYSGKRVEGLCPDCGFSYYINGRRWTPIISSLANGKGCPCCSGREIGPAPDYKNSIWANIEARKRFGIYGKDETWMQMHTLYSSNKDDFICPNCRTILTKRIADVNRYGLFCSKCGDGRSYPNKIIFNVIEQLQLNAEHNGLALQFETEKQFNWSDNKLYDMYCEYNGKKIIIEMHGIQHYEASPRKSARSIEDEQQNDRIKRELALNNNINHYIVIDSRESNIDFIKNNMINSDMCKIFDMNCIDWDECDKYALLSNKLKEVAELYNDGYTNRSLIAAKIHVCQATVGAYFKKCKHIGLVPQDAKFRWTESQKKHQSEIRKGKHIGKDSYNAKAVIQCNKNDGHFIKFWYCATDVQRELGIRQSDVSACCCGRQKSAGGFVWRHATEEEIEKYINIERIQENFT